MFMALIYHIIWNGMTSSSSYFCKYKPLKVIMYGYTSSLWNSYVHRLYKVSHCTIHSYYLHNYRRGYIYMYMYLNRYVIGYFLCMKKEVTIVEVACGYILGTLATIYAGLMPTNDIGSWQPPRTQVVNVTTN